MHDTGRGRLQLGRLHGHDGIETKPRPPRVHAAPHAPDGGSLDESWCWSPINGLTATEAELNATCTQFYVDPVDTDHACKLRGRLHAWLLGVLSGHEGEQRLRVQKHSGAVYCCPGLASA